MNKDPQRDILFFAQSARILVGLEEQDDISGPVSYVSSDVIMDIMYVMRLISFY